MATVRTGQQAALLVVDVQVGVMATCWDAPRVVGNVVRAVERARASGIPVIWVQHQSDELPLHSAAWQLVPELFPLPQDQRVNKRFPSSFEQTNLEDVLSGLQISHLVLAGAQTNWCIRATAYAALDRGYDLTLLQDAHTTESIALDDGSTVAAASMVADLNVAMTWLRYPGRTNRTAKAADVDYAAAAAGPG